MKKRSIDVLNLEWTSYPSRDRQSATLVCNYLRYMGYEVVESSIFNGYEMIERHRPKLLFMTNMTGAKINFQTMKHAHSRNIIGLSLISEGNIKPWNKNIISQFFWGWNKDQRLYENINMQWSFRSKKLIDDIHPELNARIKVSGGCGFDYYKIVDQNNKAVLLKKYKKTNYKRVIGVGCFDFGPMYKEDSRYSFQNTLFTKQQVERFKSDQKTFNEILVNLIEQNENILFIIKEHPGNQLGYFSSAIEGTGQFSNTLILKTEESVFDCINASDFWITYESTTALEAWLMDKQTMLINPSGVDFKRDELYRGSPSVTNVQDAQNTIVQFYKNQQINGFEALSKIRGKLIQDTIGWDDGLNHVRAGNQIIKLLTAQTNENHMRDTIVSFIQRLKQNILWHYSSFIKFLPYFRYYVGRRKLYSKKELITYSKTLYKKQVEFYKTTDPQSLN